MIDLYTWTTPNGRKVSVMLEECGIAYAVRPVNIRTGEQFAEDFLRISPNGKIPAIVDQDAEGGPLSLFESGAILIYLAEKTGRFLPKSGAPRSAVIEWLMFQMASVGPMFGQLNHFANSAPEKIPYAIGRYTDEALRLLQVMERRLAASPYIAGEYSIADMALYPWVKPTVPALADIAREKGESLDAILRWLAAVGARPAVSAGMGVPQIPVI